MTTVLTYQYFCFTKRAPAYRTLDKLRRLHPTANYIIEMIPDRGWIVFANPKKELAQ